MLPLLGGGRRLEDGQSGVPEAARQPARAGLRRRAARSRRGYAGRQEDPR